LCLDEEPIQTIDPIRINIASLEDAQRLVFSKAAEFLASTAPTLP